MTAFLIRRLIQSAVTLILITLMVFLAMRLLPGDPIFMVLNSNEITKINEEELQAIRHELGLDKPIMLQYFDLIAGITRGDFGKSIFQSFSPLKIIGDALPITLILSVLAFLISLIIGIPAGIICAIRRGMWIDTVVTILANIGITVPIFWLGTMLIYVFALKAHWLPVQGYTSPFDNLVMHVRQIIMPVFCLAIFPISANSRQTRSCMLEVMSQDYIRTAWSKGLKERIVVMKHALKNSLIPVITLSGLGFSYILGGSVLIETVFNIPGMGRQLINSVFAQDYPVVQCFILIIATFVLFINLVVDISYGWIDPRIKYE
jgi:peptide/nickel transport system permease protein